MKYDPQRTIIELFNLVCEAGLSAPSPAPMSSREHGTQKGFRKAFLANF